MPARPWTKLTKEEIWNLSLKEKKKLQNKGNNTGFFWVQKQWTKNSEHSFLKSCKKINIFQVSKTTDKTNNNGGHQAFGAPSATITTLSLRGSSFIISWKGSSSSSIQSFRKTRVSNNIKQGRNKCPYVCDLRWCHHVHNSQALRVLFQRDKILVMFSEPLVVQFSQQLRDIKVQLRASQVNSLLQSKTLGIHKTTWHFIARSLPRN